MMRHFRQLRHTFEDSRTFLEHAVEHSQCDKYAVNHFKHSTRGYIFDDDYETFQEENRGEMPRQTDVHSPLKTRSV